MASTAISGGTLSNPYYQYITTTGIIVPDTSTLSLQVQGEWTNAFGSALSLNPSTPQGLIISMETLQRKSVLECCSLVANQLNPNTATGIFLDAHGAVFAVSRFGATHSNARCLITGVPGTVIPAGSQVRNADNDIFQSQEAATIGDNGQVYIYFYAQDAGPITATGISSIATPVDGWETVTSVNAVTGGNTESDAVFRARINDSRYTGLAMLQSVRAKLNAIENISGYALYNNGEGGPKTILNEDGTESSVVVNAHSICLIVNGGDHDAIAEALHRSVSLGCGYTGLTGHSVSRVVYDQVGPRQVPETITFNTASEVTLDVEISVKTGKYAGDDLRDKIVAAITSWAAGDVPEVDGISIGSPVSPFEIGAAVSAQLPEIILSYVKAAEAGKTPGYAPVAVDAGAIAIIPEANISVVIDGATVSAQG